MSSELKNYLLNNYSDCINTVTELSKNLYSNESSVTSDKQLFNFDKLVKKFVVIIHTHLLMQCILRIMLLLL